MMYDEYCFERHSERAERDYLSQEAVEEKHTCCAFDCEEEAVMKLDGAYYCAECGSRMIEDFGDKIEEISRYKEAI